MSRTPLDYVGADDPVPLDKQTWNAMIDGARYARAHASLGGAAPFLPNPLAPVTRMFVANGTGLDLDQFSAVKISGVLTDPIAAPGASQQGPASTAGTFASVDDAFAILLEPLPAGATGLVYAATGGVSLVKLSVGDAAHRYARPKVGANQLESATSGPCRIVWQQAGTGAKLARVAWEAGGFVPPESTAGYAGSDVVRILNLTGGTIPIRSIVRTFTPVDADNVENATTDPDEQQIRPLFRVTATDNAQDQYGWVVTIEAIANGAIGRAVIQGVAVCDVAMTNPGDLRAEPSGNPLHLISSSQGSAKILWVQTGSGLLRAVVLLEGRIPHGSGYDYKTDCEEVEGFDEPVNVRYRRLLDLGTGMFGPWEFDSYQGCCGCSSGAGSSGTGGSPGDYGGPQSSSFGTSATLPATITDNACITLPVAVSGMDRSAALAGVAFTVAHNNVGQLTFRLTSPGGRSATLVNKPQYGLGDSPADGFHVRLHDGAAENIQTQTAASGVITGAFAPADGFSVFEGENPNGTWLLQVCDTAAGTTGTVTALKLCFGTDTAPAFTIDSLDLDVNDGAAPLTVTADPTITGGTPDIVTIDWGDGSAVWQGAPADLPQSHTYTTAGDFEIVATGFKVCGGSAGASALVAVGATGGTLGGCTVGGLLAALPNTTCLSGALNTTYYPVESDGAGNWVFDAGGAVAGGGITLIRISGAGGGAATAHVEGNCADGTTWSGDLTQSTTTCSPLSMTLSGTLSGGASCSCNSTSFALVLTEVAP